MTENETEMSFLRSEYDKPERAGASPHCSEDNRERTMIFFNHSNG